MSVARKMNRNKKKKNGEAVMLGQDARRWYENLVLKEQVVRSRAQEQLKQISLEAGQMMDELSTETGVEFRQYEINWTTGEAKPKQKGETDEKAESDS
jgi:hypothetical protein